jgi:hypothetical protein
MNSATCPSARRAGPCSFTFSVFSHQTQHWLDRAQALGLSPLQRLDALAQTVSNQAFMLATNDVFWLSGWVFPSLTLLIWLARAPQKGGELAPHPPGHGA